MIHHLSKSGKFDIIILYIVDNIISMVIINFLINILQLFFSQTPMYFLYQLIINISYEKRKLLLIILEINSRCYKYLFFGY